jgi:hypothetical protein
MGQNLAVLLQGLIPTSWFGVTKKIGNAGFDANGSIVVSGVGGINSKLFMNASQVVKPSPGMVCTANVIAAGSGTGGIYDCTSTAAAVTANQICTIPETVGQLQIEFPCLQGITVLLGTGQQVSMSYQ